MFHIVNGIKANPGWKGRGLSYYNLIWNAKRLRFPRIIIFEDDCDFSTEFLTQIFPAIQKYLDNHSDIWTLGTHNNVRFVGVNKMHSMAFNIYNASIYNKICAWRPTTQHNQIDQYIKNLPGLRVITTYPFHSVGHKQV